MTSFMEFITSLGGLGLRSFAFMIKVTKGNLITNICFYFSNKGSRNIKVQPWGLGSWHHRATDPSSDAEISGAVAEAAGPSHCTCLSMPLTNEIQALRQ